MTRADFDRDKGTPVRVVHAELHRGDDGVVIGAATQAGMDYVVDFGNGDLAEYRWWELVPLGANEDTSNTRFE